VIDTTKGSNGTSTKQDRYFVQWVTKFDDGQLEVVGYCVRDNFDPQWKMVFEHKDEGVCKKICKILNEGA
jgi:hypothetical protein